MKGLLCTLLTLTLLASVIACRDYGPLPDKSEFTYPFVPDSLYRDTMRVIDRRVSTIPVSVLYLTGRYQSSNRDSAKDKNSIYMGYVSNPPRAPQVIISPSRRGSYIDYKLSNQGRIALYEAALNYHLPSNYQPDTIHYRGYDATIPFDTIPYTIYWQETGGPPRQARGETIVKTYPSL